MDYKTYLSHRDHYSATAGIKKAYGSNHYYAQQPYIVLSEGLTLPKLDNGEKLWLTPTEEALDLNASLTASREPEYT